MSDEETAPEMLSRLGADGMLWAQEFNKTAVRLGYLEMDEGWLVGWFANAIENCDVIRCNPLRAENEKLQAKCETIYDELLEAKGQVVKLRAALKQLHEAATEATNGLDFDEWWKEELDEAAAALKETGDE